MIEVAGLCGVSIAELGSRNKYADNYQDATREAIGRSVQEVTSRCEILFTQTGSCVLWLVM